MCSRSLFAVFPMVLWILTISTHAKDIDSNDIGGTAVNPINVNTSLRKALLQALTELESEDSQNGEDEGSSKTLFFSTTARPDSDKIVEKAAASVVNVLANEDINTEAPVQETTTQKQIVIVQKSDGIQHKPIITLERDDQFLRSASSSFTRGKAGANSNLLLPEEKHGVKSVSITPKPIPTTPIPTSTEESEAKVEQVQFFSAPLVAAFTVHQDERGLPKKVEPIFKVAGQTAVTSKQLAEQQRLKEGEVLKQQQEKIQQEQYRLALHEKQRQLEEQIYQLQQQQKKHQDYLLRQQQLLLEQQLHNQRLLIEQQRLKQNDKPFVPIISSSQNHVTPSISIQETSKAVFHFPSQTEAPFINRNQVTPFISTQEPFRTQFQSERHPQVTRSLSSQEGNANFLQESKARFNNPIVPSEQTRLHFQQENNKISPLIEQNNNHFQADSFNNFGKTNKNQFKVDTKLQQFNNQVDNKAQLQGQFRANDKPNIQNQFNNKPSSSQPQFQQGQFNQNRFVSGNTLVSLQPSLALSPSDIAALPLNAQILPIRNAIDFHQGQTTNFDLPTSLTPPSQQAVSTFGDFQSFSNNFVQSLPDNTNTRNFRQESAVGNLGFNLLNNPVQNQIQSNRFFRSNLESFQTRPNNFFQQSQNVNQQLNNLLYQSGISRNVRQNGEDLSIVSKVLSYNVGRDNLFAGSRVSGKRLPAH